MSMRISSGSARAGGAGVTPATTPSTISSPLCGAGTNQTILPSSSISTPHAVAQRATMLSPRPKVSSRSSSSSGSEPGISGTSVEPSRTSTRGCSRVPRTRTVSGGVACSRALVTSSETPSSAHSTRSLRSMSWQVSTTQRRASCTPRGPEPRERAGLFSGNGGLSYRAYGGLQRACGGDTDVGSCTPDLSERNPGATGSARAVQTLTARRPFRRMIGRCDAADPGDCAEPGPDGTMGTGERLRDTCSVHVKGPAWQPRCQKPRLPPRRASPGGGDRLRLRWAVRHQGAPARPTSTSRWSRRPPTTSSSRCSTRWRPASSPRARSPRRPARSWPARRTPRCCSARSPTSTSEARTVTSHVLGRETVTPYDSLIVAAGAGQSYFGNDHFAEFAPGMKSIDDALELRGRIFGAFELAELGATRGENVDHLLTFVVVGAGPTGVEMAGQIAELAHRTLRQDFRAINSRHARVILVDAAAQVLPPFGAKLGEKTKTELEKLGVEVDARRDGHRRRRARPRGEVQGRPGRADRRRSPRSGRPASQANPLGRTLSEQTGAPLDRAGRIAVNPDLTLPGPPRGLRGRRHDRPRPPARCRAGRDPGRQVRRQGDRQPAAGPSRRRGRSSTSTRARWRPSAGSARWR